MTPKIFRLVLIVVFLVFSPQGITGKDSDRVYGIDIENNLVSIGKNIIVNSTVSKSLIKFGGRLQLNGKVNNDVVCIGTEVKLGKDFRINGDLIVIGGSIEGKNKNLIKGDIHHINFSFKKIDTSLTSFTLNSKTVNLLKVFFLLLSLIISLIIFGIMPKKIARSEEILQDNLLRVGSLGILSVIGFMLLFLISVILSFIYIGIPILLILLILLICLFLFGRTVMYYSIGKMIINKFDLSIFSPAVFILIGVVIYLILNFIPVIGFILLKVLAIFELGTVIGFIFKKQLKLKSISEFIAEYGNH